MAIHNLVINYAQLKQAPQIAIDRNTGIPINGYVVVKTIRADRFIDDGNDSPIKEDYPIIFTTDPAILQEMQTWSKNDMVEIKGTFATRKINKSQTCPKCGTRVEKEGELSYINPIYAKKRAHVSNDDDAHANLVENREISNIAFMLGRICIEPKKIVTAKNKVIVQYPLAVNRKYRNKFDEIDEKTDYPWIKEYGEMAANDLEKIHVNTIVFVDGCVQARTIKRACTCPNCKIKFEWPDKTMEIAPYSVEYVDNYYTDEDILKMKEEESNKHMTKEDFDKTEKGKDEDNVLSEEDKSRMNNILVNIFDDDENEE